MKYAAGIVIASDGGALVVVEKRPRRTTAPPPKHWRRVYDAPDEWEDELVLVGADRLAGSLVEMVDRVAERLRADPLKDDHTGHLEVSGLGARAVRLFSDRNVHPIAVELAGDVAEGMKRDTGVLALPLRNVQAAAAVVFAQGRVVGLESLKEAPTILNVLAEPSRVPSFGPVADLARAAMLAVWAGDRYASGGPWASSKPPKKGSNEEAAAEEHRATERLLDEMRLEEEAERKWWRA